MTCYFPGMKMLASNLTKIFFTYLGLQARKNYFSGVKNNKLKTKQ